MSFTEAKQFVARFVTGEYTPEEYATFLLWLKGATVDELNEIADEHEALHDRWDLAGLNPSEGWISQLEGKLDRTVEEAPVRHIGLGRYIPRRTWIAAASAVVVIAGATFFYMQRSAITGEKGEGVRPELSAMSQTLAVPKGGEAKQLVLADGSKVWLNAASELKYPSAFSGPERVVELSGEAYFEVAPDAVKPFRVLIRDAEIEVLGTNFNVMAYADEPVSRTTLVSGLISMETKSRKVILKPGQQAEITYPSTGGSWGEPRVISGVDADAILGWKKGDFRYTNESVYAVMRMLTRFYNVDIQYDQAVPDKRVTGIISRSNGLKQNLHQVLESMGLHFTINGNTVKVTL
jgi:transmembrane sensor